MSRVIRILRHQPLGALALLAVIAFAAADVSGAADEFLRLGRANMAGSSTRLRNTGDGAPLELVAQPGMPPLRVSNSTLVPRLNAALLGGKPASAFALATAPQLLYITESESVLKAPDETASVGHTKIRATGAGRVIAVAQGWCSVSAGSMLLVAFANGGTSGRTYDAGYDGYCDSVDSAEVKAGDRLSPNASLASFPITPAAHGTFAGTFAVYFQPE